MRARSRVCHPKTPVRGENHGVLSGAGVQIDQEQCRATVGEIFEHLSTVHPGFVRGNPDTHRFLSSETCVAKLLRLFWRSNCRVLWQTLRVPRQVRPPVPASLLHSAVSREPAESRGACSAEDSPGAGRNPREPRSVVCVPTHAGAPRVADPRQRPPGRPPMAVSDSPPSLVSQSTPAIALGFLCDGPTPLTRPRSMHEPRKPSTCFCSFVHETSGPFVDAVGLELPWT